jgi:hypothetical protein
LLQMTAALCCHLNEWNRLSDFVVDYEPNIDF